jgi:hypothetical protein
VEIEQLAELNERLKVRGNEQRITAADLDLDRAPVWSTATGVVPTLAADSILERLCYDGPPDFPYIHAHFMTSVSESPAAVVDVHSHALRELSRLLHLRGVCGNGSSDSPPPSSVNLATLSHIPRGGL